jgi:hypothetical protein
MVGSGGDASAAAMVHAKPPSSQPRAGTASASRLQTARRAVLVELIMATLEENGLRIGIAPCAADASWAPRPEPLDAPPAAAVHSQAQQLAHRAAAAAPSHGAPSTRVHARREEREPPPRQAAGPTASQWNERPPRGEEAHARRPEWAHAHAQAQAQAQPPPPLPPPPHHRGRALPPKPPRRTSHLYEPPPRRGEHEHSVVALIERRRERAPTTSYAGRSGGSHASGRVGGFSAAYNGGRTGGRSGGYSCSTQRSRGYSGRPTGRNGHSERTPAAAQRSQRRAFNERDGDSKNGGGAAVKVKEERAPPGGGAHDAEWQSTFEI